MARAAKKEKQLTLHFAGDDMVAVLTRVKALAKAEFRTPEQQTLYLLATHPGMIEDSNPLGFTEGDGPSEPNGDDPRQLKLFDDEGNATGEAE